MFFYKNAFVPFAYNYLLDESRKLFKKLWSFDYQMGHTNYNNYHKKNQALAPQQVRENINNFSFQN